jgi:4-hydroxyphenylpyruvate dioxygenase
MVRIRLFAALREAAGVPEVEAPAAPLQAAVTVGADGIVRIALNLVPSGADRHAILPQHIAFAASDVLALAESARDRGFRPLDIPANYYDDIEARYDIDPLVLDKLKELNVLYDRDETGDFLHFYTRPIGTVFLEVVERRHGYEGYGALNAPVRLAAQYQQRGEANKGRST